jgi:hypothetical protein
VVESFFEQMGSVVLAHDLDLASKLVVRALHQLELAHVFMLLNVLSESLLAALVVAFNNLEQAAFIMGSEVFEDDD